VTKSAVFSVFSIGHIVLVAFIFIAVFPMFVHAQASGAVRAKCPVTYPRGSDNHPWDYDIQCVANLGEAGRSIGVCVKSQCLGQSFSSDVASGQLVQQGLQMLQQLLQQMMQKQGAGGGGGAGGVFPGSSSSGCTQYYQVTQPSSDPCAIYNPNFIPDVSGPSGVSDSLLDALVSDDSDTTASGVSSVLLQQTGDTSTQGAVNTPTNTSAATSPTPSTQAQTPVGSRTGLSPGLTGDVRLGSAGATIIANLREGLSEVAGFFGGSTVGASQSLSTLGKLCSTRPWAGGVISNLIPSSFFDGLCLWRGYSGSTPAPSAPATQTARPATQTQQVTPPAQVQGGVPAKVDIWAEPASVRLGTRTYIFWNATGVISCLASGPSFSQNTLSGGASTVPISGPSTFKIDCLTNASTTVSDSTTVNIAI
jgi:hypothetical protein